MRRRVESLALGAAALTAAALAALPGAQAASGVTVVVDGARLPADARSELNIVGCGSVLGRTVEDVAPMIGAVPGGPAGKRSVAFDLAATGNAIGSLSYVDRVAATTVAGLAATAEAGTTGVAYVGYRAPADAGTDRTWIGRADLAVRPGAWTSIDVTDLDLVWTPYDLTTGQPVGATLPQPLDVGAFTEAMGGDGPGFYFAGFGCDGHAFNTDAWRIGTADATTTYDFEGYAVALSGGQDVTTAPGAPVTLSAHVSADRAGLAGAQVVLERRDDEGDWVRVEVATGPDVAVRVAPKATTTYRWKIYSTSMVEGDTSAPFTVHVAEPDPTDSPDPSASSSPAPTRVTTPAATPTRAPTPEKTPEKAPATAPEPAPAAPSEPAGPPPSEATDPTTAETTGPAPAEAPVPTPAESAATDPQAAGSPTPAAG